LIGNIGGYVGLLLGVSILQVPNLLLQLFGNVMKFCKNETRQSVTTFPDSASAENGERRSKSMLSLRACDTTSGIINERRVPRNKNDVPIYLNDIIDNQI
jgi:hypothetical protein